MTCYDPIPAYRSNQFGESGKRLVVLCRDRSKVAEISLPCGKCVGCFLDRSRQWAMRCMHEASLYDSNCSITLTFSDDGLAKTCADGSLSRRVFPLFMKRLRKAALHDGIKFFHAAEYGGKNLRPHHHALLFNCDFNDKVPFFKTPAGSQQYTSEALTEIWGLGHATVGDLNYKSAAYVARYCLKKAEGSVLPASLTPEFCTMSRGGRTGRGIGFDWYQRYKTDCFPSDFLVINGSKVKPPRYYERLLSQERPQFLEEIKAERLRHAGPIVRTFTDIGRGEVEIRQHPDATRSRLADRAVVKKAQIARLRRTLGA